LSAFAAYACYYDLLYRDKNYEAESEYIAGLLSQYAPDARTILDIGCGTGAHARDLARKGFVVHGVDISEGMLAQANETKAALEPRLREKIAFSHGDARTVELGRTFDAVVSLFHVMSYQTSNRDLLSAFASARRHLNPGGVFVFDCWYGPAVLTDRPKTVTKTFSDNELKLERLSEPTMDAERNTVEVSYTLKVTGKPGGDETIRESHLMRYLFTPELEMMLGANDLKLETSREWMTDKTPGFDSWNVCYVARA
jgi:SAM-dependent methyltransferase